MEDFENFVRSIYWEFDLLCGLKCKLLCINNKTLITLRCNIPLIECCLKKTFISLRCLSEQSVGQYILMKVFSHCPNLKMWQFSNESRTTNSTHSCLDYAVRVSCTLRYLISIRVWGIVPCDTSYLFECGVLHRLFDSG